MRLNNYISSSGLCSRRKADELIKNNKVKVNSKIADLGYQVSEGDIVEVDGTIIKPKEDKVYIALYKPVGITCTTEGHIEGNIVDYVNYKERIFPIGRLDKDSEGLILLTNDGDIVNKILRAGNNHEKEYSEILSCISLNSLKFLHAPTFKYLSVFGYVNPISSRQQSNENESSSTLQSVYPIAIGCKSIFVLISPKFN